MAALPTPSASVPKHLQVSSRIRPIFRADSETATVQKPVSLPLNGNTELCVKVS
jgi:hypothetical protein